MQYYKPMHYKHMSYAWHITCIQQLLTYTPLETEIMPWGYITHFEFLKCSPMYCLIHFLE